MSPLLLITWIVRRSRDTLLLHQVASGALASAALPLTTRSIPLHLQAIICSSTRSSVDMRVSCCGCSSSRRHPWTRLFEHLLPVLWAELLGPHVDSLFYYLRSCHTSPRFVTGPFYIPIINARTFPFLFSLRSVCYFSWKNIFLVMLVGVKLHLTEFWFLSPKCLMIFSWADCTLWMTWGKYLFNY